MTEPFFNNIKLLNGGETFGIGMATRCYNALYVLISTREYLQQALLNSSETINDALDLLQLIETTDEDCPLPPYPYGQLPNTHLYIPNSTLLALRKALADEPNLLYEAPFHSGGNYVAFGPKMMASITFALSTLEFDKT